MSEKFLNALKYVNGSDAHSIWKDLNPGVTENVISLDSMRELVDFFDFSISKNVFIEYDIERNVPVFSGDAPKVVAQRLFNDFTLKVPNVPINDPLSDDDFVSYLMFKRGWAVLFQGTKIILPED